MNRSQILASVRPVGAFVVPALAPALAFVLATAPAAPAAADAAAETGQMNPVRQLVDARKYQEAILAVEELRAASEGQLADPESELAAAHAETRLRLHDAARDRFRLIAKRHANTEAGREATVEAPTALLRQVGGMAETDEGRSKALQAASELIAAAETLKEVAPDRAARALYIAGNAYWIVPDEDRANAAWERVRAEFADQDYAARAIYKLAISANRAFDVEKARALYTECAVEHSGSSYASRCQKNLSRLDVVGTPAPPIMAETWVHEGPVDIGALHGKAVLLWFFATWCPHCKETMPEIARLKEEFAGKPFQVVGVTNNTRGQTTAHAQAFVADPQWQITYPVAVDLAGRTSDGYGASAVPSAALIDKTGTVRWAGHPTYLTEDMIETLVNE